MQELRALRAPFGERGTQDSNLESPVLKDDGLTVRGAAGQWRLNAAVTELRQGRLALARLLEQVCLDRVRAPEADGDDLDALLEGRTPDWLRPVDER